MRDEIPELVGEAIQQCKTKGDVMAIVLAAIRVMLRDIAKDEIEKEQMRAHIYLKMLEM